MTILKARAPHEYSQQSSTNTHNYHPNKTNENFPDIKMIWDLIRYPYSLIKLHYIQSQEEPRWGKSVYTYFNSINFNLYIHKTLNI